MIEESFLVAAEKTKADEDCTIGSLEHRKDETNEDETANLEGCKNTDSVERSDAESEANLEISQKRKRQQSEKVLRISSSMFKKRKTKKQSRKKSSFSSSAETTDSDSDELSDDTRKEIERNNDFVYNFVDKLPTGKILKISSSLFPKRKPKKSTVQKSKSSAGTMESDADKLSDGIKKEIVDDNGSSSKVDELPKSRLAKRPKRIYKPRPQKLCDICDKVFADSSSFAKHKRVHLKENPYKCEQCYKSFRQSNNLKRHMRIHTNDLVFSCDQCPSKFSCPDNLKRHKVVHEEEKPFKCLHCSCSFTRLTELKTHMVMHTRKELFKCEICAMSFSRARSVQRHVHRVHFLNKPRSKII